jgi:putative SOS response-associated peptidase YedK
MDWHKTSAMCNLYSITTNQAAIIALFRVVNPYVGNLPPMPGVFPDYPAPVIRNADADTELVTMRWGMPPPPRTGVLPCPTVGAGQFISMVNRSELLPFCREDGRLP